MASFHQPKSSKNFTIKPLLLTPTKPPILTLDSRPNAPVTPLWKTFRSCWPFTKIPGTISISIGKCPNLWNQPTWLFQFSTLVRSFHYTVRRVIPIGFQVSFWIQGTEQAHWKPSIKSSLVPPAVHRLHTCSTHLLPKKWWQNARNLRSCWSPGPTNDSFQSFFSTTERRKRPGVLVGVTYVTLWGALRSPPSSRHVNQVQQTKAPENLKKQKEKM